MADYITNTSESINGSIIVEIGTGGTNTVIDSYVDTNNAFTYEFDLTYHTEQTKSNVKITFTDLDKWQAVLSSVVSKVFKVKIGANYVFQGVVVKDAILEDYKSNKISFTFVEESYENNLFNVDSTSFYGVDAYLNVAIGSTVTWVDNPTIVCDVSSSPTSYTIGFNSSASTYSILLTAEDIYRIPFVTTLLKILGMYIVYYNGSYYVVPKEGTTTKQSLSSYTILDKKRYRYKVAREYYGGFSAQMGLFATLTDSANVVGYSDNSKIYAYNNNALLNEEDHFYCYDSVGSSRTVNWTTVVGSDRNNSIDIDYTVTDGTNTEKIVKFVNRGNFAPSFYSAVQLSLRATYLDSNITNNIRVSLKVTLLGDTTWDDMRDGLYISSYQEDTTYFNMPDKSGKVAMATTEYSIKKLNNDANRYYWLYIGHDAEGYASSTINTVSYTSGQLVLTITNYLSPDYGEFKVGRDCYIRDVTNYTGTYTLNDVSASGTTSTLKFTTANTGTPALGTTPRVFPMDKNIQFGISDIEISYTKIDKEFKQDDNLPMSSQCPIKTNASVNFLEVIHKLNERTVSIIGDNNPSELDTYVVTVKGQILPYNSISYESNNWRVIKYKYDYIKDITVVTMGKL